LKLQNSPPLCTNFLFLLLWCLTSQHARAEADAALLSRAAVHALAASPGSPAVWWRLAQSQRAQAEAVGEAFDQSCDAALGLGPDAAHALTSSLLRLMAARHAGCPPTAVPVYHAAATDAGADAPLPPRAPPSGMGLGPARAAALAKASCFLFGERGSEVLCRQTWGALLTPFLIADASADAYCGASSSASTSGAGFGDATSFSNFRTLRESGRAPAWDLAAELPPRVRREIAALARRLGVALAAAEAAPNARMPRASGAAAAQSAPTAPGGGGLVTGTGEVASAVSAAGSIEAEDDPARADDMDDECDADAAPDELMAEAIPRPEMVNVVAAAAAAAAAAGPASTAILPLASRTAVARPGAGAVTAAEAWDALAAVFLHARRALAARCFAMAATCYARAAGLAWKPPPLLPLLPVPAPPPSLRGAGSQEGAAAGGPGAAGAEGAAAATAAAAAEPFGNWIVPAESPPLAAGGLARSSDARTWLCPSPDTVGGRDLAALVNLVFIDIKAQCCLQ